jgi:DNA-binding Lrp family transcriptional regulator
MKQVKTNLNLNVLLNLLESKSISKIAKELNISKQALNYYIKTLKANGNIEKIGYGTWKVKSYTLKMHSNKKIRGHAFIWTIKLNKPIDWTKHLSNYQLIRGSIPRIIINNQKIWLGKKTITIYDNRSFYGENSIESRKYAVHGLKSVLEALESKTSINLRPYGFKVCKEHYSMIKNELARQYNEKNEKMIIRDDIEGEWLWIDDSDGLNELETKNIVRSKQVQDWWNDNKRHDFKITPTFLMESINQVTSNQLMFAKNLESHVKAMNDISESNKLLQETIKELKEVINDISKQTR